MIALTNLQPLRVFSRRFRHTQLHRLWNVSGKKDMSSKATPARISETAMQAAPAPEPDTQLTQKAEAQKPQETPPSSSQEFSHERCSELAYSLWRQRGCPEGSADEDWLEAERQLRNS
jgi:hypothetical protein